MRNHDPAIAAEAYDWDNRVTLGAGIAVTLVAARHWSARNLSDRNMSLWASFVIETPGGSIYFVADSGYGDGWYFRRARERHGPFRLAILPIGAYEPRRRGTCHRASAGARMVTTRRAGAEPAFRELT